MVANTNVLDAAYHTVHDFPGGTHAMAQRLSDVSPNVLNKQIDPNVDTHVLGLSRSVKIQRIAKDPRILHAMAFELNHVAIPLPEVPEYGDMSLLDGFMDIINEMADFTQAFQQSWADGKITSKEFERIKSEAADVQARFAAIVARIGDMKVD